MNPRTQPVCTSKLFSLAAGLAAALVLTGAVTAAETPTSAGPVSQLDTPIFRIPMTKQPPTIDGVMEEEEWVDASALSAFWYDRYASHFMFMAPIQTQLQVYGAYDEENLYIAYSSPVYPEKSWLKARGRFPDVSHHPQYGLIWDDHIELEIRPYHDNVEGFRKGLFKWFVNPIATYSDQYWSRHKGEGYKWQSKAQVACDVTDTRWTLEIAIPLESMVHERYAGKDEAGRPIVQLPPPAETSYRVWFTRAIGGNGAFFNAFDAHPWNTTKTRMILDPATVSFQVNELGPIMDDVVDVRLTVKNHNDRSETVRIGFFVESAEGNVYSSYEDEQLRDGLLELVPGEVRELRLEKKFPGISLNGNVLWFDVRSAGTPARPIFRTRLVDFHHMEGGRYSNLDGTETSFRWARIDVIERMRPPRKDFDFKYTYSHYNNRISAVVDRGIHGASEESQRAVEAKLVVMEATEDEKIVTEKTVPFKGAFACMLFDLPELKRGAYRVSLLLFDENKRIVGESNPEPFYHGEYEWVNNDVGAGDVVWEPFEPIKTTDDGFETLKHRFDVSPSGLPAQIAIKPDPRELPLEKRGKNAKPPTAAELRWMGRGPQLRAPMRIEASVEGGRKSAEIVEPAKLVREWKSELEYASKLKVGPLDVDLDVQYDCDGAMTVRMTYGSDEPATVDALEMLMDVEGLVDMAVSAAHGGGMAGPDRWECGLPEEEGVVWDSADIERPALYYSHFIPFLCFGSGDRAFTWIADSDRYWTIDKDGSTMTLERDDQGRLTWRVKFVNHTAVVEGRRTVEFMLLTHPAKPKPGGFRRIAWFQQGDVWAHLWGPKMGSDEEIQAAWRQASGAPKDLPADQRATFGKADPPWSRFYQLRGVIPAIPSTRKNALTGDLIGESKELPQVQRVKRIVDGEEQWVEKGAGGTVCNMGRAWQDLFVWHFGRHVRLARRHGWWWDETWPTYRSSNLASGEAYLRDPSEVGEKELPWQDQFLTLTMRGMFKRLARVFAEEGVPLRNYLWANNSATAFESFAWDTMLVEECSSAHRTFEVDHVVTYPNELVKYNAHNFTGLVTRLAPQDGGANSTWSRPGDDKRLDRQLFGRCLLNDIGVRFEGPHGKMQHNEQAVRLMNALIDFGYFADDGMTEMIPYWRTDGLVRYGEAFDPEGSFELTETDPNAEVYVTIYRRPILDDNGRRRGYKAMFVIMNESDQPVRGRVFLLDRDRVLGGENRVRGENVVAGYDWERIEGLVPQSDWRSDKIGGAAKYRALIDMEDRGLIKVSARAKRGQEIYGPVFIRPHDYRVLEARTR